MRERATRKNVSHQIVSDQGAEQPYARRAPFVVPSELKGHELADGSAATELRTQPKRVTFESPLNAKCMSIDGTWCTDCMVLAVWEGGARLQVNLQNGFNEFFILFTSSSKPVFRQCKRVWTRGNEIGVEYQRKEPSYSMQVENDR